MSKLQDSFRENALNEEKILGRVSAEVFEKQAEEVKVFENHAWDAGVFEVYEKRSGDAGVFEAVEKHADEGVFEERSEGSKVFEKQSEESKVSESFRRVYEIRSSDMNPKAKVLSSRTRAYLIAAAAILLVVGIGALVMLQQNISSTRNRATQYAASESVAHNMAFAMISVDINPSFEVYVDANGNVLSIEAINEDAKTLDVSLFVGLPAQEAVADIIDSAETAGFINTEDQSDDYVLVTTVLLEEENPDNQKKQDNLGQLIRERVEAAGELGDTTKVAIIKATKVELFEAREKDVPMGLYVINGMIENNGEMIPVSEFVKNKEHLDKLKDRSDVVDKKDKTDGDETDPADGSSDTGNNPQSSNANPNATKQNETGPNPNSTKQNETGPNPNSTKQNETGPNPNSTKPNETTPNPNSTKNSETAPNPDNTKNDNKGGSKNG